jgi:NTE family protein
VRGDGEVHVRADVVLEGGGAKGVALGGAVAGLLDRGVEVQRVAGTSAGAIVAALVAAGLPASELERLARELNLATLVPETRLRWLGPPGRGIAVLLGRGQRDHRPLRAWLSEVLADAGVETFGDLASDDPDADGSPLRPGLSGVAARSRLVVAVSDITRERRILLPWDLPDYGLDPDRFPVVDAVIASAAIPLIFAPVRLSVPRDAPVVGDGRHTRAVLVDGGLTSNFPVDVFDRTDGRRPRWPTIGVKLSARPDAPAPLQRARGPLSYLRSVITTAVVDGDNRVLDDACVVERTVFADTAEVGTLEFDLDPWVRAQLVAEGRAAAERWFAGWDEEAYLGRCRA